MRVLYANSGNMYGGVETLLVALARYRNACPAMEPQFALCFEGKLSRELRELGCRVHMVGNVRLSRPWTVWRARRALRQVVLEQKIDVVIPHGSWNISVFGPEVHRLDATLACWIHDPPKETLTWPERLASLTRPSLAICNSQYTADRLTRLYPGVPYRVIYCAVTPPAARDERHRRAEVRRRLTTPEDATVVLQVSRLDPHKGHIPHIEALGKLRDIPGWICWIVASPQRPHETQYLGQLKERAAELGITDRLRFLEWQPSLAEIFAAADIFCQPNSGPEPFGLTFIEAMWAGLPVVTTAMGGPLEILTPGTGVLVPPGDVGELARNLAKLLTDGEYRQRLSRNAPERADALCAPEERVRELHDYLAAQLFRQAA